jgi:hypothetical protein
VVTGSPTTLTDVRLYYEIVPGAQCVVYKRLNMLVGPHLLYANMTGGGKARPPKMAAGPELVSVTVGTNRKRK